MKDGYPRQAYYVLRRTSSTADSQDSVQSTSATYAHIVGKRIETLLSIRTFKKVLELRELPQEGQLDHTRRTVALLRDDEFGLALIFVVGFVDFLTKDKHHLDVAPALDSTVKERPPVLRVPWQAPSNPSIYLRFPARDSRLFRIPTSTAGSPR